MLNIILNKSWQILICEYIRSYSFVHPSLSLSLSPSLSFSLSLSLSSYFRLCLHVLVCLSVCIPPCLSLCLSLSLSLFICVDRRHLFLSLPPLSFYLSLSLSPHFYNSLRQLLLCNYLSGTKKALVGACRGKKATKHTTRKGG